MTQEIMTTTKSDLVCKIMQSPLPPPPHQSVCTNRSQMNTYHVQGALFLDEKAVLRSNTSIRGL